MQLNLNAHEHYVLAEALKTEHRQMSASRAAIPGAGKDVFDLHLERIADLLGKLGVSLTDDEQVAA